MKSAPGHYSKACIVVNTNAKITKHKGDSYKRLVKYRKEQKSKVMTQKYNRHYTWLKNNSEPGMKPEINKDKPNYENCWFIFTNNTENVLHYSKAGLGNSNDILLSFRLLTDWLVDRSRGRGRLLKNSQVNNRADL